MELNGPDDKPAQPATQEPELTVAVARTLAERS